MKEPASSIPKFDDESKHLVHLLDAFGSVVSLEDIASAYCQAHRDIHVASEILCNIQGSTSGASNCTSKDELESDSLSSECPEDKWFDKSNVQERDLVESKQKKYTASAGSVSGVIGREYARFRPSRNESSEPVKPLKLNSEEFPASQIWSEEVQPDIATVESVPKDMDEFLFKMLAKGFQLDLEIIQQVLGFCGYNAEKSMEKLSGLSASTLGKIDGVSGIPSQNSSERYSDVESFPGQEEIKIMTSSRSDKAKTISENGSSKRNKDRNGLQKQVLQSLFTVPDRFEEEAPRKIFPAKPFTASRASIRVVTEPLRVPEFEYLTPVTTLTAATGENAEDESGYQLLRKAVKEYWVTMTQYYKAAVDAFAKGDHIRGNKLMEEGHFFQSKAREADEESARKFLETKENHMSLDLHEHDPKEAIRFLRVHLSSLSGITAFPLLKLIIGTGSVEKKERALKRLVTKFLERENITWTEENNGGTLVIRFDQIDPKKLSFYQKRDQSTGGEVHT